MNQNHKCQRTANHSRVSYLCLSTSIGLDTKIQKNIGNTYKPMKLAKAVPKQAQHSCLNRLEWSQSLYRKYIAARVIMYAKMFLFDNVIARSKFICIALSQSMEQCFPIYIMSSCISAHKLLLALKNSLISSLNRVGLHAKGTQASSSFFSICRQINIYLLIFMYFWCCFFSSKCNRLSFQVVFSVVVVNTSGMDVHHFVFGNTPVKIQMN